MQIRLILEDDVVGHMVEQELRAEGAVIVEGDEFDVLVVDEAHPDAALAVGRMHASAKQTPVLLIASDASLAEPWEGVEDVVRKPPAPGEVAGRIRLLTRRWRSAATRREALMSAALESAGDIVEITSPDARYEYVNPSFERVLGFTAEEVLGRTPGEVIRSDMHDAAYFKNIDETLSAGKAWRGLLISRARSGRLVYLESTVTPMLDAQGRITHHLAVKRDITARMQAEAELRRKKEELEQARDAALEASRAKSQFLANMSHELRTPLNAIIGYSEMLIEDADPAQQEALVDDLGKIRKAGQHLLELINDVLDISKIEAGAMKLHIEEFDLETAVNGVVATIQPLAHERHNRLRVVFGEGLGTMRADLTKVRQTLLNLLGNAAKFTDGGEITLQVSATIDAGQPFIAFEIRDTGIGIEPEQVRRLFRPFVQADASTSRKYGGTGLGLAISQRFCEMMGGRIEVQSQLGHGSVFTIRLPRAVEGPATPTRETERARPEQRRGRLVLVIDDDPAIRDLLGRKLSAHGFRVESVDDGAAGLARARDLGPSAIVLDVMMPGLDGWAVLTELKGNPKTADIPVVLLTILQKSEVGFALGAVDYLVKPVQMDRLVSVLQRHCRTDSAHVLVIDDDDASRQMMQRGLEAAGHTVTVAADGQLGIEAMATEPPDLVVLDLMMPVLDGFAVVEHMRQSDALQRVPIVIVTAKDLSAEDRAMLRGARAIFERNDYDRQELLDAVVERVAELAAD